MNYNYMKHSLYTAVVLQVHKNKKKKLPWCTATLRVSLTPAKSKKLRVKLSLCSSIVFPIVPTYCSICGLWDHPL